MIDWNPLIEKCHAAAVANGWWEQPRAVTSALGLITTEPAEALEWYREWKGDAADVFAPHWEGETKPVGIPSELGDTAIRVCDAMGGWKLEFIRDGAVKDLPEGDFASDIFYIQQAIGRNMYPSSQVMSAILIRIEQVCAKYGIDLAAAIETKLAYNATRGHRHGGKRA